LLNRKTNFLCTMQRRRLDTVFPESQHHPPFATKFSSNCTIPRNISLDFVNPKSFVDLYFGSLDGPSIAVPKMAVAKNHNPVFLEHKIRMSKHLWLHRWTQPELAQGLIKDPFNQGTSPSYLGHVEADLLRITPVYCHVGSPCLFSIIAQRAHDPSINLKKRAPEPICEYFASQSVVRGCAPAVGAFHDSTGKDRRFQRKYTPLSCQTWQLDSDSSGPLQACGVPRFSLRATVRVAFVVA